MSACNQSTPLSTPITLSTPSIVLSGKLSPYPFTEKMEKPASGEIKNIDTMQYGFKELWKKTISKEDASPESWDVLKKCAKISVLNNDGYSVVKELTRKELEKGNVEITGQYDGLGLSFELSPTQKTFLSTHGWVLFDP
ncbi:MAG: hypothetical protein WCL18_06145 [bacterium]